MKLLNKPPEKGRFDLHDLSKLDDVRNFGIKPYEEEWNLASIVPERAERTTFIGVNSHGEFCHIGIEWIPLDSSSNNENDAKKRILARVTLQIKIIDENVLTSVEEEIISVESLQEGLENGRMKRFKIGSLLVEIRRPLSCVRLLFRGFVTDSLTSKKRFMKLNLFSTILTRVFDNLNNFCFDFMKKQFKGKKIHCHDSFEQWIQLKGQIEFESTKPQNVFFWGLNLKSFEEEPMALNHLYVWNERGQSFHLVGVEGSSQDHIFGHLNTGLGIIMPLEKLPSEIKTIDNISISKDSKFSLKSPKADKVYEVEFMAEPTDLSQDFKGFPLKIMNHPGYGLLWKQQFGEVVPTGTLTIERPIKNVFQKDESFVVSLDEESAKNEKFTGGKGSSLAVLREFSKISSSKFNVPDALIVTVEAYKAFLEFNNELKHLIDDQLVKTVKESSNSSETIKQECESIQSKMREAKLPDTLIDKLKEKFQTVFGTIEKDDSFAVRSSAIGEDSEEMSAAGQMTTFLGVRSFESICESLKNCWASQFSQTAVEYKRGYGQALNSPMAVVLQNMIASEVAGVMFTCSPMNGNESLLSITASYGLGESVVSGSVEPDTFTINVNVDNNPRTIIGIENKVLGDKKMKIELAEDLTSTKNLDEAERHKQCLTDEQVLHLAKIGLSVHAHYKSARDIEFAFSNGTWHLLQSRPVTNLNLLNEWEIFHELDTGHHSENEVLSRHNVGEVFPGACSYLAYDFVIRGWNTLMCASFTKVMAMDESMFYIPYTCLGFHSAYNAVFFNGKSLGSIMGRKNATDKNKFGEGMQLTFRGLNDLDEEMLQEVFDKMPDMNFTLKKKLIVGWRMPKTIFGANKVNKKMRERFKDYKIDFDFENSSSLDLWNILMDKSPTAGDAIWTNAISSQESMFYHSILYYFLATKTGLKDQSQILDLFSKITSSLDDVFSARVPAMLQKIASEIDDKEKFLSLADQEALEYLNSKNEGFRTFLQDFGHRGLKEFDPGASTWGINPIPLVQSLKSSVSTGSSLEENRDKSFDLSKYPLTWFQKKILKSFIIPRTHRGIRNRESAKNLAIRVYHEFRKLFHAIADKLVVEGKLPQRELLFHLTLVEIEDLINKPSPLTIINAKNRMRLQSKKESFCFNEDTFGCEVTPRNFEVKAKIIDGAKQLLGMPISSGKVIARCCIAETLEDAKNIQKGDILITYSTDIGWSPYFGALSGLVTEIGGLMSHGAVIAREYGLPCLVGVTQATLAFESGDTLLLDTATGLISKIEPETEATE